jgi:transposase
LDTKLHSVTDTKGCLLKFFMTAGQVSDYTEAAVFLSSLPIALWMLTDRGYDADWFRDALKRQGDTPLHPRSEAARQNSPLRQKTLSAPLSELDNVRSIEGLAPHRNPLRQVRQNLPLRRRPRRNRNLLALTINEPGS